MSNNNNKRLVFKTSQKQELIDYLKRTENSWAFITEPENEAGSYYEFPYLKIQSYNPNYKEIKDQIDKMEYLEQNNKPGLLNWSEIKLQDVFPLIANSFWDILKDTTHLNFYPDFFTIDNRLLAISLVLLFLWAFL
jgi:hypothetical protein